ncbi:hypothetical protein C3L33_08612, partial [Rhododendron williamsianum]
MASLKILVALAIFAIAFPSTLATEWVVGVFNYKQGSHNVVKVNGTDFQACKVPIGAVPLTSGHDVIPLSTPGKHWYICGFPNHCTLGMKLVITVLPELSPFPSPAPSPSSGTVSPAPSPGSGEMAPPPTAPPPSAATGIAFSKCHAWFVGVFSILMMIMA